jgi:hypothetical protein
LPAYLLNGVMLLKPSGRLCERVFIKIPLRTAAPTTAKVIEGTYGRFVRVHERRESPARQKLKGKSERRGVNARERVTT